MIKKIIIPVICGTLLFSQTITFAAVEDMLKNVTNDITIDDTTTIDLNESEYGITEPDELIPADIQLFAELDTQDPTQREKIAEAIYKFSEEFIEPNLPEDILEAYREFLDSLTLANNITMGVDLEGINTEGEGKVFVTLKDTNNQFALLLALLQLNTDLRRETYRGVNYYGISEESSEFIEAYLTRIDDIIVFTNSSEAIEKVIDLAFDSANALSNDTDYNTLKSNLAEIYVASIYVDVTRLLEMYAEAANANEEGQPLMQITDKLMIALTLEDDGWYFTAYTLGNESVIDELGLPFNLTDFTPNIYQKFPAAPTIFYAETENLGALIQKMLNTLLADYGYDPNVATETAIGLNLETEILVWLDKELAVGIQDSGEVVPAITVMINASSSPVNAQKLIDYIDGLINALMVGSRDIVTKETVEIDGGTLHNVKIDLIGILEEQGVDPDKLDLLKEILPPLELTYGLTGEDLLILSNYPNLPDHYGEGLNSNEDVEVMMTRIPPENGGFSYLSPTAFFDYTNRILGTFDRIFPGELDPEFLNGYYDLQELLYKFQDVITTQTNQRYERGEKIFIRIDETAEPPENTYETAVESKKETDSDKDGRSDYEEEYIYYTDPYIKDDLVKTEFKDVSEDEWYSPHVHSLANKGAIKGYETAEGVTVFNPNQPITRAEFTKIVLEAFDYDIKTAKKQTFLDVHPQDWHYDYIYTAYQKGLVQGYPDKTFHPNDPITRAEGLKIVLEAYGYYESTAAPAPFTDTKGHWAEYYVNYGYSENVVSGVSVTSFEPNRPITRAEAAKIVNNVNKLKLDQLEKTSAPAQYTEGTLDIFVDTLF